ncbi:MAG: hypothetical protein JW717_03495 [Marinilabiliaceae bacterium]|nr:hypothetical protein [Marinilabiliaceae bacterium]
MGCQKKNDISLCVAGIQIDFNCLDASVFIDHFATSNKFILLNSFSFNSYKANIERCSKNEYPKMQPVFHGNPWGNILIDYNWTIFSSEGKTGIQIDFKEIGSISSVFIVIDKVRKNILICIDSNEINVKFDPFMYPFGVLLYVYLVNYQNGLMIHASGVDDGGNGFLFTGLSGIGKSTMAGIWAQKGANVINDDRLIISPLNGKYFIYNTPMPFYTDVPKMVELSKIFILKQSKENYINKLSGVLAYANVMSNCIQHLFAKDMVQLHADIIGKIISTIPVYELGFKPDTEIVDLIRQLR